MTDFSFIEDETVRQRAIDAYNESLKEKIAQEVDGLKRKNEELLNEKKTVQQKMEEISKKYEGIDAEKAKEALRLLSTAEKKELLDQGKMDEYIKAEIQNKTSEIEFKYQSKLEEETQLKKQYLDKYEKYESLYKNKLMEDQLRDIAIKSGIRSDTPTVIDDFIMRGKEVFSLNSEGRIEARDKDGNLVRMKDDIILTPIEWANMQKKERPYWYPDSVTTGSKGSGYSASAKNDLMDRLDAAAKSGDFKEYKRLQALSKKK